MTTLVFISVLIHLHNHRMVEAGRDFWRSSCPIPVLKQAYLEQSAQTMSRRFSSVSKDSNLTTAIGHLFQCSVILTVNRCFLMFRQNLPCYILCLLPLALSLGNIEKGLVMSSLHAPFRYLFTFIDQIHSSFLFSRLNCLSSLSFSSHER